jgi:hypothetical protein
MIRFTRAALLCMLASGVGGPARADEPEAKAVIDRAIKASGGEEKLSGVKAYSVKGKGTVVVENTDIDFTFETTAQGIDKFRATYEGEVGGEKFAGSTVVDGDKAWKKEQQEIRKLDGEKLANEKRGAYLEIAPTLLVPLRSKAFKLESAPEEKVGEKAAAVVRVTGPDGKDFTLYFDKETGLLAKISGQVADDDGQVDLQETTVEDYKEFAGIKVATRSYVKRSGKRFVDVEVAEFKALDEVEPGTFAEPK